MSKRLGTAMLLLSVWILTSAGMAAGAKYPDVSGDWKVKGSCAVWDQSGGFDDVVFSNADLIILSQNSTNGNFYGTFQGLPLTGNVKTDGIFTAIIRGNDDDADFTILTCKVVGKRIVGTWNHHQPLHIDTCKITITRP